MRRLHLFEFEDQAWLPVALRDFMTDFLRVVFSTLSSRVSLEALLVKLLDAGGTDRIVDLASGGGGPIVAVRQRLETEFGREVQILLTDKYPNIEALEAARDAGRGAIDYHRESLDAKAVPKHIEGIRTVFTAFHHFPPEDAQLILADASACRRPIAVFEATERTVGMLLITMLVPVLVWIATPFMRPFRPSRWLLTYLLPVVPLLSLWDGLVSCLRTYSPRELEEMAASVGAEDWTWEAGYLPVAGLPCRVTYLLGYPAEARTGDSPIL